MAFKLATAKSFGMIEGRTNFSLTEIAKRYYFPTDEADRQGALLDFLKYPPAFKKLIGRFDGSKLPENEIIANILHRECGVPVSWKDRVATFFIKSAQFAVAIDEQGHLRVQASREGRQTATSMVSERKVTTESELPNTVAHATNENQIAEIVRQRRIAGRLNDDSETCTFIETYGDKTKAAYIELPKELPPNMWKWVMEWVQKREPKGK